MRSITLHKKFPGGPVNSRRFPGFPGVVDTLFQHCILCCDHFKDKRLLVLASYTVQYGTGYWQELFIHTFHFSEHFLENSAKTTDSPGCFFLCSSRQVCTKNAYDDILPRGFPAFPIVSDCRFFSNEMQNSAINTWHMYDVLSYR